MNRNPKQQKKRADFVKLAIQKPEEAAEKLRLLALGLKNVKNTSDSIEALKEILYLSEVTIFRDLKKS